MVLKKMGCLLLLARFLCFADNVGILPLDVVGVTDAGLSETLPYLIESHFVNSYPQHTVVERSQIRRVLSEQGLQMTGATHQAVEAGKIIGADHVVFGSLSKLGSKFTLVLKYVNVATGEVLEIQNRSAVTTLENIEEALIRPAVSALLTKKAAGVFSSIVIKMCRGLPSKDRDGLSDAYVEILVGGRSIGRTKTKMNSNNPSFYERFSLSGYRDEEIFLRVYDKNRNGRRLIGGVALKGPRSSPYSTLRNDPYRDKRGSGEYGLIRSQGGARYKAGYISVAFE